MGRSPHAADATPDGALVRTTVPQVVALVRGTFMRIYADALAEELESGLAVPITICSNRHPEEIELPVSAGFRVCDLQDLLIRALRLPSTTLLPEESFRISISYALKQAGRRLTPQARLDEALQPFEPGARVEFATRIFYEALRRRAIAAHNPDGPMQAPAEPSYERAVEKFTAEYDAAWLAALQELREGAGHGRR